MQTEHNTQMQIPHHPEVPFRTRQAVLEERISSELARIKRAGEEAGKLKSISDEHRAQAISLLGCDNYGKLRSYLKEQKRTKERFFLPPRGPEMSKGEVESFHRERKEEALAWSRELKIDIHQLGELGRRTASRMKELAPSHPYLNDKRLILTTPSGVPSEIRSNTASAWSVVGPPYGWSWWYNGSVAGFSFHPTLYLDSAIGLVGNVNFIQDSDASDNDYGYMKYASNVLFWYQMPSAGLVEVWIEAQCRGSHHRVTLIDEWGWSDSSANQHNYLTLNASLGGSASELQMAETSWFSENGNTDGYWDNSYIPNGNTFWANLTSDPRVIYPAGSWVLVEVGSLNFNSAFANDVEVYSALDVAWIIKRVSVHSTGM